MRVFVTNFIAAVMCVTSVACGSPQAPAEPPAELLTMCNSRTITHVGMVVHDANAELPRVIYWPCRNLQQLAKMRIYQASIFA